MKAKFLHFFIRKDFYSAVVLTVVCLLASSLTANATVTITAASGGTNISADKAANSVNPAGGAFTTLGNFTLTRNSSSDFTSGTNVTFIISTPAGWVFNTGGTVTATRGGGVTVASASVTSSTTITCTYTCTGSSSGTLITLSGIQVQATSGSTIPQSGNITRTGGTGTIAGFATGAVVGALSLQGGAISSISINPISFQAVNVAFSVTMNALDQFDNTATFSGSVNMSTNAGTISPTTATFASGTVTTNFTLNTAGASRTITATNTSPAATGTSNSFLVIPAQAATDLFRSKATGTWATAATWERSPDGVNWVTATTAPTGATASTITIRNGHVVTVSATLSIDETTIETGGQVSLTSGTLTIASGTGTDLDVSGSFVNSDATAIVTTGTIVFESGGQYLDNVAASSTIPTATWNANSTCFIDNWNSSSDTKSNLTGQTFGHFTIDHTSGSSAGTLLPSGGTMNCAGNFTFNVSGRPVALVSSGSVAATLNVAGDFILTDGEFILNNGTSGAVNLYVTGDFSNAGTFTSGTSTCTFNASGGTQTLNSGGSSFNNVSHNGAGTLQLLTSALTTTGTFTNSAGTFDANGLAHTVTGLSTLSGGTYLAKTGTQTFNGGLTLNGGIFTGSTGTVSTTSVTLTSGTLTAPTGAFNVSGSWTRSTATFTPGTGTVTFNASSGTQTLNSGGISFNNITHSAAGTLQLSTNALTTEGTFTNSSGSFDANGLTHTVTGLATISGGTYLAKTATQTFNGGLTLSGGTFTGSTGAVTVTNVTLTSGTLTAPSGTFTVTGNWSRSSATFTPGSNTVTFDGTTQAIAGTSATTFNILTIADGSTTTGTTAPTISVFNINAGGKYIQPNGTAIPGTTRNFAASSTYEYQTTAQTSWPAVAVTWGNLIINVSGSTTNLSAGGYITAVQGDLYIKNAGTGSYRLAATTSPTINISGDLIVDAGILNFSSGTGAPVVNVSGDVILNGGTLQPYTSTGIPSFTVSGNWTKNSGAFTPGSGTVTFNGSAVQTIAGTTSTTFYNLTNTNTNATGLSIGINTTVSNILALNSASNGKINTGASTLIVSNTATAAITGASSSKYINGYLQRGILAGANTYSYPIGTATVYAPVTLAFTTGTIAGTLTGNTVDGDHTNIGTSTINGMTSVNRYWHFAINSGLTTANYGATFNWVSGDQDPAFAFASAICGKYTGTSWTYPTMGTLSSTSAQITGASGFSDFQIGNTCTSPTITLGGNPSVCQGTTSANLSYSGTSGSPDQYSIVWSAAALSADFSNVTNAALPASPIVLVVPGNAPAATYTGTFTVRFSTTGCTSTGYPISVTVNAMPVAPTGGGDQTQCQQSPIQTLTANATPPIGCSVVWYDAASGGNVVASPTLNSVGTVTYYAASKNNTSLCYSDTRTAVTLTINAVPSAPVSGGNQSECEQSPVQTLTAHASVPLGSSVVWYDAPTGGNIVSMPVLNHAGTVTYYAASQNNTSLCFSLTRTDVTLTIIPAPGAPTSGGNQAECEQSPIQTLTASATAPSGCSVVWYDAASGGSIITNPVLNSVGSVVYYAESKNNTTLCTSVNRTAVSLVITSAPAAPTSGGDQTECIQMPIQTLTATATAPSGASVVWYDEAIGGNIVAVPSWSAIGSITYYASSLSNTTSCASLERTPVTLTINVCTPTWAGSTTDYHDCGNWAGGICPSVTDDVIIPSGCTVYPVLGSGEFIRCHNMTIGSNDKTTTGTPEMGISGEFTVDGDLTINSNGTVHVYLGGWVTINGNLVNSGSFIMESGSSLITNGTVSGTATVKREIAGDLAWHLLSSPVNEQNICNGIFAPLEADFGTTSTDTWDFYNWAPNCPVPPNPAEHWRNLRTDTQGVNYTDFGNPPQFEVTKGYLVGYGSGFPTTKSFAGTPNTGDKVCSYSDIISDCSWELSGNPFPSAIDWSLVTDKSNLVADYYYVWNENKDGGAGYEFWKDEYHSSSAMVNGKIPPMQGFFVKADPAGGKFIGLPNSARVHDDDTWLKNGLPSSSRLDIKLSNGVNYDEAFIMFEENGSIGQDRNDAEKLFSTAAGVPQVYTIVGNSLKTGLNSLPYMSSGTVPIGIVAPSSGNFTLTFSGLESFWKLDNLSLEDLSLNHSQNLLENPTYSFTASGNEDAGRFLLHFSGPIAVDEKDAAAVNIYASGKTVFVTCDHGFKNAVVTVCNLLGQEILTQKIGNQTVNRISLGSMSGYYIVKVQDESSVKTAKVYIY
jgi:hypothetical protein